MDLLTLLAAFLIGACTGLFALLMLISPRPDEKMEDWQ